MANLEAVGWAEYAGFIVTRLAGWHWTTLHFSFLAWNMTNKVVSLFSLLARPDFEYWVRTEYLHLWYYNCHWDQHYEEEFVVLGDYKIWPLGHGSSRETIKLFHLVCLGLHSLFLICSSSSCGCSVWILFRTVPLKTSVLFHFIHWSSQPRSPLPAQTPIYHSKL